jgi:arylsulfatase A-like enzyme
MATAIMGEKTLPSFVLILADDLGAADLSVYGHPTMRTPHLDRMAAEGVLFTQAYSAAPICTPSRAAFHTGRLPVRTGLFSNTSNHSAIGSLHAKDAWMRKVRDCFTCH